LYATTAILAQASLVLAAFVVATHVILAAVVVWQRRRAGGDVAPLERAARDAAGDEAVERALAAHAGRVG
jgi:hypothetical protein